MEEVCARERERKSAVLERHEWKKRAATAASSSIVSTNSQAYRCTHAHTPTHTHALTHSRTHSHAHMHALFCRFSTFVDFFVKWSQKRVRSKFKKVERWVFFRLNVDPFFF